MDFEDRTISEDEFHEVWGAHVREDGDLFQHEDVRDKPLNLVWTIVDTDENHWIAVPGFHLVNRLGYCLTRQPWTDATLDAYWFLNDLEDEGEGEDEDQA